MSDGTGQRAQSIANLPECCTPLCAMHYALCSMLFISLPVNIRYDIIECSANGDQVGDLCPAGNGLDQ